MRVTLLLSTLLSLAYGLNPAGTKKLKIGISMGYGPDGGILLDAALSIHLRIKQMNEKSTLLGNNVALEPVFLNHETMRDKTIVNSLEFQKQGVVAVVGSGYSSLSILTSLVLQNYKIPQCCGSSSNPSLSDKKQYPNFFRAMPTDASQAEAMVGYAIASGWKKIAIIHTNEDYGSGLANYITNLARTSSIEILAKVNVKIGVTAAEAKPQVQTVQESGARIIIYCGYVEELSVIIPIANELGIMQKDYVWMASDSMYDLHLFNPSMAPIYGGLISFYPREAAGPEAQPFADYWVQNRELTTFPNWNITATTATKSFVYLYASCVDLFLNGFDKLLKSNSTYTIDDLIDGKLNKVMKVPESFMFPEVATPSGYVKNDANGDRIGDYDIFNFRADGTRHLVGGWNDGKKVLDPNSPIIYMGGSLVQPKDGIDPNDVALYAAPSSGLAILSVVFAIIGALVSLVSVLGVMKYRLVGVIKKSSMIVGYGMQLCLLLVNIQFLIMIDKPTNSKCTIDTFVIPVLFSFYYGLLFAKNLRIYRIFYKPRATLKLTDFKIYVIAFLITIPSVVISAIWNAVDAPVPTIVKVSLTQYYWTCKSPNGLQATAINLLIIVNALVLVANLYMAVMTRNVMSTYNETKMIGLSVYNMTIISLFSMAILVSDSLGFTAKYIIKLLAVFYILMFNVGTSFLFKIYQAVTSSETPNSKGSSQNSSVIAQEKKIEQANKGGNPNRCEVTLRKLGGLNSIFGEAKNVVLTQTSTDSVLVFDIKKLSLESAATKDSGYGTCWHLKNLSNFSFVEKGTNIRHVTVEENVFECKFKNEEDCKIWSKYFENWSYRVSAATSQQASTNM
ncbi:periplasmic binding protein-like I [Globomyces pollinis-pini]|nr:periplasmic binding protein-like I [Globomyces pollinis-pini]